MTVLELFKLLAERTGMPHAAPEHAPKRAGDVRHSLADITAATDALGYRVITTLEEGLDATLAWYKSAYAATEGE